MTIFATGSFDIPPVGDSPFVDVPSDEYYYAPVLWAVEEGITSGTIPIALRPGNTCTRTQIVTFLYCASTCSNSKRTAVKPPAVRL